MVGEINGACCHGSELAGKTPVTLTVWKTRSLFFTLAVVTEGLKAKRGATVTAEHQTGKSCSTGSSVGARAGGQPLQGTPGEPEQGVSLSRDQQAASAEEPAVSS